MNTKKFKTLKEVIFRNSFFICTALVIVLLLLINVAIPKYFYKTQDALIRDISVCMNDNISDILSDVNYIYNKLSKDEELVKNIILNEQAEKYKDYNQYDETYHLIRQKLVQTSYCYKNVISNISIAREGRVLLNKTDPLNRVEMFMKNKNIKKPYFININEETQMGTHVVFMPFYDAKGTYICDMIFILSNEKNYLLSNLASFAITDNSGKIMLSNEKNILNDTELSRFLEKQIQKEEEWDIGADIQKIGKEECFLTSGKIDNFSWNLFVFIPVGGFYSGIKKATIVIMILSLILLVAIYFYTNAFSSVIASEISSASNEINAFLNSSYVSGKEKPFNRFIMKHLKNKNFYNKFMTYNITAVFIPMIVFILGINIYYINIINREYENTVEVMAQVNRLKVENICNKYNNVLNYILIDDNIKQKIYEYENLFRSENDLNVISKNYELISDELYEIGRYVGDYRFIYQDNYNELFLQWPKDQTGRYDTTAFESGFNITFDNARNKYVCSSSRKFSLSALDYFKKVGYCTLQYDVEQMMDNLMALNSGTYFGITNNEGVIVASFDGKNIRKPFNVEKNYVYAIEPMANGEFSLFVKCSNESMCDSYTFIIMWSLIIICSVLAFVFSVSYHMSQYIIKPVKIVKKSLDTEVSSCYIEGKKYRDEFDELSDSINEMKQRIQTLIEGVYKYEIDIKNLQMESLRLQITPHFLYNIFEVINAMVDLKDERVGTLVLLLSDFFRQGISKNEAIVTLEEELRYSKVYLKIQQFILGERLEFSEEIDDRCLKAKVPKFLIQPVLENIFKHGMYKNKDGIKIRLRVSKVKDNIRIVIRDNGIGISKEVLLALTEYINNKDDDSRKGVGLKNINERLIMYYGERYGLRIRSIEKKGTMIIIKLPCTFEE